MRFVSGDEMKSFDRRVHDKLSCVDRRELSIGIGDSRSHDGLEAFEVTTTLGPHEVRTPLVDGDAEEALHSLAFATTTDLGEALPARVQRNLEALTVTQLSLEGKRPRWLMGCFRDALFCKRCDRWRHLDTGTVLERKPTATAR